VSWAVANPTPTPYRISQGTIVHTEAWPLSTRPSPVDPDHLERQTGLHNPVGPQGS
jgi:hypothetical protein